MRVAIKLGYDGRHYHGFQKQKNVKTVAGTILDSLLAAEIIENVKDANFQCASRTDSGVSAAANVVALNTHASAEAVLATITYNCPHIWAYAYAVVGRDFNPRRAQKRVYRYYLVKRKEYDIKKIMRTAQLFVGTFDFRNYTIAKDKNATRTIDAIDVKVIDDIVCIEFVATSFLWGMIRKIVTAILMVASGDLTYKDVISSLKAKTEYNFAMAPSEGLVLYDVIYEDVRFTVHERIARHILGRLSESYMSLQLYSNIVKCMSLPLLRALDLSQGHDYVIDNL